MTATNVEPTNDYEETTTPHENNPTVTTTQPNANPKGSYYWETFETALQQPRTTTVEQQPSNADGVEDTAGSTPRWAARRRRRRRRGSAEGSSSSWFHSSAAAPHQQVEIAFASHYYDGPPPKDDHNHSTTSNKNDTSAAAATLLRRIRSTGDLPSTTTSSSNVVVVWQEDDDDAQHKAGMMTALCPSTAQSPLVALLGNWNNHEATTNDDDDNDDDDASRASSTLQAPYFEPDDYDPWWWHESLVRHPPATVGVAVVALAAAIVTHPVVFLAAALTAWGSVAAAHQGYHYYWNNNDSNNNNNNNTTPPLSWWNDSISCFESTATAATTTTTTMDAPLTAAPQKSPEEQLPTKKEEKEPLIDTALLSPDDRDPITAIQTQTLPPRGTATSTHQQRQEQDWLDQHYPPLKHTVVQNGGHLVGINCVEFFHVFFDDDAVYSFKEFQRQRHDRNIEYGPWTNVIAAPQQQQGILALDNDSNNNNNDDDNDPAISLAPGGATRPSIATGLAACGKYRLFRGRTLSFQAKTNSFLGPPYANTVKKQRMLIVNARLAILESRTRLSGIPFGDRFRVLERWIVTASKVDGRYVAQVASASCEVVFDPMAICPWEQQIKHKSATTIRDIVTAWCVMATEALQRTEQAKLSRRKLQEKSALNQDDDETTLDEDTSSSSVQTNGVPDPSTDNNNNDDDDDTQDEEEHHAGVEVVARHRNEDHPSDAHHTFYLSTTTPTMPQSTRRSWLRRTTHSFDP